MSPFLRVLLLGVMLLGASAGLHHPEYNFNDSAAPIGASYFARLVETSQPVKAAK